MSSVLGYRAFDRQTDDKPISLKKTLFFGLGGSQNGYLRKKPNIDHITFFTLCIIKILVLWQVPSWSLELDPYKIGLCMNVWKSLCTLYLIFQISKD